MGATLCTNCPRRQRQLRKHEVDCVLLGMRQAGKTTILNKLRLLPSADMCFTDMNAGDALTARPQQRSDSLRKAVIYVVDSDEQCLDQAYDNLIRALDCEELDGAALLLYASKQDRPKAFSVATLTKRLKLHSIQDRPWFIQRCSGLTGQGIHSGLDWLQETIRRTCQARLASDDCAADGVAHDHRVSISRPGSSAPAVCLAPGKSKPSDDSDGEESVSDMASTADTDSLDADCLHA